MLEKILDWHRRIQGIEPVFLRYFNAAGATDKHGEDHDPETHIIPNVLKVALGQAAEVNIFGNDFSLLNSFEEVHKTPFETTQNFIFCEFQKKM